MGDSNLVIMIDIQKNVILMEVKTGQQLYGIFTPRVFFHPNFNNDYKHVFAKIAANT